MSHENKENLAHAKQENLQKLYPAGTQWDIDIPHVDLVRIIDEAIVKYSNNTAIDFMGKKITYQELGLLIAHAAKGLQDMGVKKGTKVGLYMPNTPFYPIMFFAALKVGATVVNYSPLYTEEELRRQVKDSGTTVLVTNELKDYFDKAHNLVEDGDLENVIQCPISDMLPTLKSLLYRFAKRSDITKIKTNIIDFKSLTNNNGYYEPVAIDPDSPAVLQYTGGTTGVPKGAMLSHFNLVANACQIQEFFGYKTGKAYDPAYMMEGQERVLATIPYFHVFGMMTAMISPLKMGSELVILPNPRDIDATINTIHKKRPTMFPAVPRLLQAIGENPKAAKKDLSSMKKIIAGGAPLTQNVKESFEEAVGNKDLIYQGYGLSETSPVATSNPPGAVPRSDTVGMPYPNTEIKITDPDNPDKVLDIGEVGEICIRGPQVMSGYYNRPEETEKVMTKDGWFRTGDLGFLDKDLYVKIVDRKKRMLIVNGHNAYPTQIESELGKHPAIAEAVVIGLPDERSGEAAKAFVRFKPDLAVSKRPSEEDLRAFLLQTMNRLDVPKFFEVREEELPKTSVGKPDFKALENEELEKINKKKKPDQGPKP